MGEYMQKLCFIYILFAYSDIIEKKTIFYLQTSICNILFS